MSKILIVEDDKHIRQGLLDNLEMEGYTVVQAEDGLQALEQVKKESPDLIILDITLPELNGFEVCKTLKKQGDVSPIIILSSRSEEVDKVLGLELGADDYVTKPFSPRELMVRVKAVLRRTEREQKKDLDRYTFGNIIVDFKKYQVFRCRDRACPCPNEIDEIMQNKDKRIGASSKDLKVSLPPVPTLVEIKITPAEFTILKLLITNEGQPVSRHTILGEIWSEEVTTRTIDTHIWKLREKLEEDPKHPQHIITVHRIGYKFIK